MITLEANKVIKMFLLKKKKSYQTVKLIIIHKLVSLYLRPQEEGIYSVKVKGISG